MFYSQIAVLSASLVLYMAYGSGDGVGKGLQALEEDLSENSWSRAGDRSHCTLCTSGL